MMIIANRMTIAEIVTDVTSEKLESLKSLFSHLKHLFHGDSVHFSTKHMVGTRKLLSLHSVWGQHCHSTPDFPGITFSASLSINGLFCFFDVCLMVML